MPSGHGNPEFQSSIVNLADKAFNDVCPGKSADRNRAASSFKIIYRFLERFPESLSTKKDRSQLKTSAVAKRLAKRFVNDRKRSLVPKAIQLSPDTLVEEVLRHVYGHSRSRCRSIIRDHQQAMKAENCIGALLERYVASQLSRSRWVWCSGNFVKNVDFISYSPTSNQWRLLQVKNRDNTENAPAKSVRDGTPIMHWFRCYSKTGRTNWPKLNAILACSNLSEKGFRGFVASQIKKEKRLCAESAGRPKKRSHRRQRSS